MDETTRTSNVDATSNVGGIAGERLQQIIDKIERLEEEKKGLADDIKDVMGEAKATGFDPKIIRTIIRLRKKAKEERQEEEQLLELYKAAIGMD